MPDSSVPGSGRPALVLIGPPAAGKSRLGKRIAKLLDLPFIDTDKRIVASHGVISEIFETQGEPHFRELERAEVATALTEGAVVALGGGAVLHPETRDALAGHRVVLITVTAAAVEARISGDKRPLLKDGMGAWIALVEARTPLYESLATKTFDTSNRPIDAIAAEIAAWIQENPS